MRSERDTAHSNHLAAEADLNGFALEIEDVCAQHRSEMSGMDPSPMAAKSALDRQAESLLLEISGLKDQVQGQLEVAAHAAEVRQQEREVQEATELIDEAPVRIAPEGSLLSRAPCCRSVWRSTTWS